MPIPDSSPVSRRFIARAVAAAGFGLLTAVGPQGGPVVAQDDDHGDHDRGRGRGRGGDRPDNVPLTAEIPAGAHVVRILNDDADGFSPATLGVDVGETIAFANTHHDEHTATGPGIDSGIIGPGAVVSVIMRTPGEFRYACQFHPEMTGLIRVRDASGNVPAASDTAVSVSEITIASLAFDPSQVAVAPGTTVTWTNEDTVPHTVSAVDGAFDSGILDPGATFSFAFDQPGNFTYQCLVHPSMTGSVQVGDGSASATTVASPVAGTSGTGLWSLFLSPLDAAPGYQVLLQLGTDGDATASLAPLSATNAPIVGPALGAWHEGNASISVTLVALTTSGQGVALGTIRLELEFASDDNGVVTGAWGLGAAPDRPLGEVTGARVLPDPAL